uniref:Uncharacterized protein n=1 Tax=Panagrolaimus sp. ES5 TaxID=591445 RepID=A0AC34GIM5_9BILA
AVVEHRNDLWCTDIIKKYHPETMICIGGAATGVAHGDSRGPLMAIRNNKWYALGSLYAGFFESIPADDLAPVTHGLLWVE